MSQTFADINVNVEKLCDLAKLQQEDTSLSGCFNLAKRKKAGFFVDAKTGILYKSVERRGVIRNQLVLPMCKREKVLEVSHQKCGHFGIKNTLRLISKNFVFPKMKERVTQYVASCLNCAQRRVVTKADRVKIKPIERPAQSLRL